MPITAKLSNKFYERLGDDVANELVEWLNLVDTSYRQEFRDLFEANFGRVEARLGAMDARIGGLESTMTALMGGLDARVDARLQAMEMRIAGLETVMGSRMSDLETRLLALVDAKLEKQKSSLLAWTLVFWLGTMGTVLAMLKL